MRKSTAAISTLAALASLGVTDRVAANPNPLSNPVPRAQGATDRVKANETAMPQLVASVVPPETLGQQERIDIRGTPIAQALPPDDLMTSSPDWNRAPTQSSHQDFGRIDAIAPPQTATPVISFPRREAATPLAQRLSFFDIEGHWAQTFIRELVARDIIRGFADGSFRPEAPVTRAQFATMLYKAFQLAPIRSEAKFADVSDNHWAREAIQAAYSRGFLQGYPGNLFKGDREISRLQVLVALANGLKLSSETEPERILSSYFRDASTIPLHGRNPVAVAAENGIVVNYPNLEYLNPNATATRAEVAAFIYQALVRAGQLPALATADGATQYVVGYEAPTTIASKRNRSSYPESEEAEPEDSEPEDSEPKEIEQRDIQELQSRIQFVEEATDLRQIYVGNPAISGGSPTAFGADLGYAFAGAAYQNRARNSENEDGAVSLGFGIGSNQAIALEIAATSFSTLRQGFGNNGSISFKLHRALPEDFAIAAGIENAIEWGGIDTELSLYGVVSKIFRTQDSVADPFSRVSLSFGVGNGRFRSEGARRDDKATVNVFGNVSLRMFEPLSIFADWTGQDLNLGFSLVPFRSFPLVITPAIQDVTGNAGDGTRFSISVGTSYRF